MSGGHWNYVQARLFEVADDLVDRPNALWQRLGHRTRIVARAIDRVDRVICGDSAEDDPGVRQAILQALKGSITGMLPTSSTVDLIVACVLEEVEHASRSEKDQPTPPWSPTDAPRWAEFRGDDIAPRASESVRLFGPSWAGLLLEQVGAALRARTPALRRDALIQVAALAIRAADRAADEVVRE